MKASCGGCDTTWTGQNLCHCSVCHNTFKTITPFDKHFVRGEHRHPDRIMALVYNEDQDWWTLRDEVTPTDLIAPSGALSVRPSNALTHVTLPENNLEG